MGYIESRNADGKTISVYADGVGHIPPDFANTDYQRYLAWLADGNEPEVIEG